MTNEKVGRLDLLVLSYCHFAIIPLSALLRHDIDCSLNMPHHGLSREAMCRKLAGLAERGWLEVRYGPRTTLPLKEMNALRATGWEEPPDLPDDVVLANLAAANLLQSISQGSRGLARHVRVSLSEAGGQIWSNWAKPRWYLYVTEADPDVRAGRVELRLRAASARMIEFVGHLLRERGNLPVPRQNFLISETGPWRALPWKTLHRGFHLGIDTGVGADTRQGEAMRSGLTTSNWCAAELVGHLTSLWNLDFRRNLRSLARLPPTFETWRL